jgi:hypothetical protein
MRLQNYIASTVEELPEHNRLLWENLLCYTGNMLMREISCSIHTGHENQMILWADVQRATFYILDTIWSGRA